MTKQLDTDNKFHFVASSATKETLASIQVHRLKDGSVEITVEESTKKWNGKRWHSSIAFVRLDAEQAVKLSGALTNPPATDWRRM